MKTSIRLSKKLMMGWEYIPKHFLRITTYKKRANYTTKEITRVLERKR